MTWTAIAAAPEMELYWELFPAGEQVLCLTGAWSRQFSACAWYAPAADAWEALAAAPIDRRLTIAHAWTGSELLLWGGMYDHSRDEQQYFGDGVRLQGDAARPMSGEGAPSARMSSGVWTGEEMIVSGGSAGSQCGDGARYRPATDTWRPMAATGAPAPRWGAHKVWNGREMLVWGGRDEYGPRETAWPYADGAAYDPAADAWRPLRDRPGEAGVMLPTGDGVVLVLAGDDDGLEAWRYDGSADTWALVSKGPSMGDQVASRAFGQLAVHAGRAATVVYDHASDRWTCLPAPPHHTGTLVEAGGVLMLFADQRGWRFAPEPSFVAPARRAIAR